MPRVRARGVGVRYAGRWGLVDLDLEVDTGERVALIGPNGSGKTTLIRLLATDLSPSAGELHLLGADRPSPALRRRIGYARDHPIHYDALTGAENLRLFTGLRGSAGTTGSFGIDRELEIPVRRYSFGMRRKLLLMEAFAGATELLVLDEPTVGLDPDGTEALGRAILERSAGGTPVIFATNEVRDVPRWASRVLFLDDGRVVADDTPSRLLERVRGETLITIQARVGADGRGLLGTRLAESLLANEVLESETRESGEIRLQLRTPHRGAALPRVIAVLLDADAEIRQIRLREPDLRDVFELLTGVTLEPGP